MISSKKKFECNFFPTVGNAKEADLRISERQVSEDLSPLEDTLRTDFEIYKTFDSFCCCRYIATIIKYLFVEFFKSVFLKQLYAK